MSRVESRYNLIIIGAGPAGLTSGIYAARYQIKHLIISENIGGLAQEAWHVENYPGMLKISGLELTQKMAEQAKKLGSEILIDQVGEIVRQGKVFELKTIGGKKLQAKSLILALGTKNRQLNVPGEEKFLGRGVSYCFTCDGVFFRDKVVAVVGDGNAAANAALALAQYNKKICLLVKENKMTAQPALVKEIEKNQKIEILYNTTIKELQGKEKLEKIILGRNTPRRVPTKELTANGLFIEIGSMPAGALVEQLGVKRDGKGYIIVDACQKTNIPGVFAAGSVTNTGCYLNQIIISCGQGALASYSANLYLH